MSKSNTWGNSNWGKNNNKSNTTWGSKTQSNTNQSNKNNAGTGTTSQFNFSTNGTSKFSYNKNQTSSIFKAEDRAPVVTPVCTIDLPILPSTVELALKRTGDGIPSRFNFKVNHILQMEIFKKYTIDEIRYYDYLHCGFIDKVKPQSFGTGKGFGNTSFTSKTSVGASGTFGQTNTNQETILKYVTPYRRKPEELKPPPLATQKQPFGALPASTITFPKTESDEPLPKQQQIPADIGFRDNVTCYEHLVTTKEEKTATPGLKQLNPQKIQVKTSKEVLPKNLEFNEPSKRNFSIAKKKNENVEDRCNYIPDLDSFHDDEVVFNFTVIDPDYGSIAFPEGFKAKKIDPRNSIVISDRKIEVNIPNPLKSELGIEKSFISIVTLKNIFPPENRKQESLREYETDLRKFCDDHNLKFISYFYEDGVLMFSVPSLAYFPVEIE